MTQRRTAGDQFSLCSRFSSYVHIACYGIAQFAHCHIRFTCLDYKIQIDALSDESTGTFTMNEAPNRETLLNRFGRRRFVECGSRHTHSHYPIKALRRTGGFGSGSSGGNKRDASPSGCVLCGAVELFSIEPGLSNHRMHQCMVELAIMRIDGHECSLSFAISGPKVLSVGACLAALRKSKGREDCYDVIGSQRRIGSLPH
jgi:hypothetical protein